MAYKATKVTTDDLIPKTDRELTLLIIIEEIRRRFRNYLIFGLFGTVVLALLVTYAIDNYSGSRSPRIKYYKEIEQLINSAYEGDPQAHAEVIRRFPVLLKRKKIRQLREKIKPADMEPMLEKNIANVPNPITADISENPSNPIEPKPALNIYSDRSEKSILLGTIIDESEVGAKRSRGEWSSIVLTNGVPAWISAAYVVELNPSLIKVSASRVGLRIQPQQSKEFIVGIVDTDDTLEVLSKQDDWYQVRTPASFEVWAKSEDLDRLLE